MKSPVVGWIILCALLNAAGWILSALGQLNQAGYLVFFGVTAVVWAWHWKRAKNDTPRQNSRMGRVFFSRLYHRFRRPLPMGFLFLTLLITTGGVLHAPANGDALSYRIPRVLHWLAENRWYWIEPSGGRENTRACGMEWLSAPVILFTGTDRWLFVINIISFLLLPGLVFTVLTRLGAHRRVAWHWMWLIPSGYCFVLQAGSIGNDAFATVYALAAVGYALRARQSQRVTDLGFCALSAGLLTGAKASNLPLLLPIALAALPSLRLVRRNVLVLMACVVVAVLVSLAPTAILNARYCGDWTGAVLEGQIYKEFRPSVKVPGNALNLLLQNMAPPVFPMAAWWNARAASWLPANWAELLRENFEGGGARLQLGELVNEEMAGLGFGLTLLTIVSFVAGCFALRRRCEFGGYIALLRWSPYVSLLVVMMTSGLSTVARVITPYYPLLLAPLLATSGQAVLVRRRWWQYCALTVMILAVLVLVLSPARPLWPARTLLTALQKMGYSSRAIDRAAMVYQVYAERWDVLAPVRALLPAEAKNVGLISFGEHIEASLWRPFGHRRIEHVLATESAASVRDRGLVYIVIGAEAPRVPDGKPLAEWIVAWLGNEGTVTGEATITVKASKGPVPWYVVKLNARR